MQLNASNLKKLISGQTLWDKGSVGAVVGLHARALATKTVFYFYYRSKKGTQRKPKIGDCSLLSISQAREIAAAMALKVLAGKDPSATANQLKNEPIIAELYTDCKKFHWSKTSYRISGWAKEVDRLYTARILKPFGSLKITDLTQKQVSMWHDSLGHTPYEANRALSVLSKLYNWYEANGGSVKNPCSFVTKHPEAQRDRVATPSEINTIGTILKREQKNFPKQVAFIYLLMYTGSRPRAIERAKRNQLHGNVLKFRGKTGWEKVIIPFQGMRLLNNKELIGGDTLTGIKMPRDFWRRVIKEAGCKDLWARDWRRTFASIALSNGESLDSIGEILNHKSTQTTKAYAKVLNSNAQKIVGNVALKLDEILYKY